MPEDRVSQGLLRLCKSSRPEVEVYSHGPEQKQSNSVQAAEKSISLGCSRERVGVGAHAGSAAEKASGKVTPGNKTPTLVIFPKGDMSLK